MRISDWSSDVCSSDLLVDARGLRRFARAEQRGGVEETEAVVQQLQAGLLARCPAFGAHHRRDQAAAVAYCRCQQAVAGFRGVAGLDAVDAGKVGRAHVWTPVTTANIVCRLLLE